MRWMPLLVVVVACGDPAAQPDAATSDAAIDARVVDPKNPPTLADTGLCVDAACTQIAPGIKAYKPRWELWSDGATKKRWIYLPPGTQIDTSNMDFWQFPVGTKLWKEFTRDGVRVETRLVMRISDSASDPDNDWFYGAYAWNQNQDATTLETFGVADANGTQHDIPSRAQCKQCHNNNQPSRVLGFSALELDYDNTDPDQLDLAALVGANALTAPPTASGSAGSAYFPLPADAFGKALPALGYLHANCGHCHNPNSQVFTDKGVQMQLRLTVGTLGSLSQTTTYMTTIGVAGTTNGVNNIKTIVTVANPDQSQLILRFESTNPAEHMPSNFIGAEIMDPAGKTILRDWITSLN